MCKNWPTFSINLLSLLCVILISILDSYTKHIRYTRVNNKNERVKVLFIAIVINVIKDKTESFTMTKKYPKDVL